MIQETRHTIYFAAPVAVRNTDRYEQFFYQLGHLWPGADLIEAREQFPSEKAWHAGWAAVLERIDMLVFMRNEDHAVGAGTWREICEARRAGKTVYLARQNKEGALVLVPWKKLAIVLEKTSKRNYVKIGYAPPRAVGADARRVEVAAK